MSFFKNIVNTIASSTGSGSSSLQAASQNSDLNKPGVYKIVYNGQLMKVGKAEDGLRKRFSDYYRGSSGGTAYLSYIDDNNRDEIKVSWRACDRNQCRKLETDMYDQAKKNGEDLPWSNRR